MSPVSPRRSLGSGLRSFFRGQLSQPRTPVAWAYRTGVKGQPRAGFREQFPDIGMSPCASLSINAVCCSRLSVLQGPDRLRYLTGMPRFYAIGCIRVSENLQRCSKPLTRRWWWKNEDLRLGRHSASYRTAVSWNSRVRHTGSTILTVAVCRRALTWRRTQQRDHRFVDR